MIALTSQRVLTPSGLRPAAVVLQGESVHAITDSPPANAACVDLGELVLMPGLVDSHVHINEPGRAAWEGFATATRAAALGGVTTVVDMPLNSVPVTTSLDALDAKITAAKGQLSVDCAFWGGVVPGNIDQLAPMSRAGAKGFKCFLCPSGIDEFPPVGEPELRAAMPALRALGRPLLVHAELELPLREATTGDARDYSTYLHSRPPEWEDEAVALIVRMVRETGARAHIVHLSSAGALPILRAAKAEGLPITAETCPHYLCLRAEQIPPGDTAFKCAPPIREGVNRLALWAALAEGVIDFVVTDHSPCIPSLKLPDAGDFLRAWGGIASLQLGLAAVSSEARWRGFDIAQVSRWMSAGPARLLGIDRGVLRPGARADLVAWDPDATFVVDGAKLAHRHPTTPYAGQKLSGQVRHVWLGGRPIVRDGALIGPPIGSPIL